ncbi:DUF6338 family protein [Streptomyces sp. AD681]|uniref:DUF6338 family protein n=1 Tax=Streptomyces sp. AD681 TaxID=3019069 RepID=UPI0022F18302|nr:DUF6338 family protein [Streptomyces sp. AD681]MDA5147591.1 DUF6338 family protein [Streptomyces sp. AD681]
MPTTFLQLAVVITAVLPGITYQFTREHARGPFVRHDDLGERLLRALAASLVLDIAYVLLFGRVLTDRLPLSAARWEKLSASPRPAALLALLLLIVVPAAAAFAVSLRERRGRPTQYVTTPSAWDHVFAGLGPCFIRVRLKSGSWVGGWYGGASYASSHPATAHDLYLESAWRMAPDGRFLSRVDLTRGLYVRLDDVEVLEFVTWEQR